jgi:protein TonB
MYPYENVIVGNSFEEIVFTNRNKEYGAYALRKRQKKYLIIAFAIAFSMTITAALAPLIYNYFHGQNIFRGDPGIVVGRIDTTLIAIDPPVPPELKYNNKIEKFTPQVVDTVDIDTQPPTMEELISITTISEPPPAFITHVVTEDPVIVPVERPFIKVEIDAQFEGGNLPKFYSWVVKNINYPQVAIDNGITGKVFVQFVIGTTGKVEDVTVLRGADPSLNEEAVRVIGSSPKWSPPIQGGKAVRQLFTLPVVFKLQD